jgi:hypothetical protein
MIVTIEEISNLVPPRKDEAFPRTLLVVRASGVHGPNFGRISVGAWIEGQRCQLSWDITSPALQPWELKSMGEAVQSLTVRVLRSLYGEQEALPGL